jgi:rod shape-determining protein MreD
LAYWLLKVSIYLAVPALVVVALLQTTIMPHLTIWGISPDLVVIVIASWGLLQGTTEGCLWGFIAGVAIDLFSDAPFGAATISLVLVGLLAGLAKRSRLQAHFALPMVVVAMGTVLYNLSFLTLLQISGQSVPWLEALFRITLPSAALNALLAIPVFALMRFGHSRFLREEMEW